MTAPEVLHLLLPLALLSLPAPLLLAAVRRAMLPGLQQLLSLQCKEQRQWRCDGLASCDACAAFTVPGFRAHSMTWCETSPYDVDNDESTFIRG